METLNEGERILSVAFVAKKKSKDRREVEIIMGTARTEGEIFSEIARLENVEESEVGKIFQIRGTSDLPSRSKIHFRLTFTPGNEIIEVIDPGKA